MAPPVLHTLAAGTPLIDLDWTVLIQLGLFIVMAVLATTWLFKPYLRLRDERAEGIDGARMQATEMSAEADAKLADYEQKLSAARARAAEEQRTIRTDAAAHEREVTEKARTTAMASLEAARDKVRSETEAARAELLPRVDTIAADMASKLLGRKVA